MNLYSIENVTIHPHRLDRRRFLRRLSTAGLVGGSLGFRDALSLQAEELRRQGRSLILLWMAGGPSQFETFDPKPDHPNGGETKAIPTAVPGIQIAAGWEQTAQVMRDLALIRSMTNQEGSHPRATYQLHTGYLPSGSVKHPHFGSCLAHQISEAEAELPSVVSIGRTEGAGFLGVDYEPFVVDDPGMPPRNVGTQQPQDRFSRRLTLRGRLDGQFAQNGGNAVVEQQSQLYEKAARLVLSPQTKAFAIGDEPDDTRRRYGATQFGRGCLLARRLVENGVTFVEVRSNGWDTHAENFTQVATRAREVDPATAALITDLKDRGLLEKTVVVWAGEFGRTPRVNPRAGRDHYPRAFSCWVAGGGIRGGQVIGATSADGSAIQDRPVTVPDLLRSLCHALNVNPDHENISPLGRPMKIVDGGNVVEELFS